MDPIGIPTSSDELLARVGTLSQQVESMREDFAYIICPFHFLLANADLERSALLLKLSKMLLLPPLTPMPHYGSAMVTEQASGRLASTLGLSNSPTSNEIPQRQVLDAQYLLRAP